MSKSNQLAKISSRECVNPAKRSTTVTRVIAKERIVEYRMVQKEWDIRHFSHSHALQQYRCREQDYIECDACELDLLGVAYGCAKCDFYLHKSCYEAPREFAHKAHTKHTLTLLAKAPYSSGEFVCNGCGMKGKGFTYHCDCCNYDLHIDCAYLPKEMDRDDHKHTLTLYYSFPYYEYSGVDYCDVCRKSIDKRHWVYGCRKCEYWCHSDCVFNEAISSSAEECSSEEDEDDECETEVHAIARLEYEMKGKFRI